MESGVNSRPVRFNFPSVERGKSRHPPDAERETPELRYAATSAARSPATGAIDAMADGWQREFDEPIETPDGTQLNTL